MYLTNKYATWYNNIITNAKSRFISKEIYTERHHIIPKSLGGDNSENNLVKLTAREHFICHLLLTKMISDPVMRRKMQFALNSFRRTSKNQKRYILTSKQYEIIRKEVSKARSQSQLGNKFAQGVRHSPETISKRVSKLIGQKKRPRTEEEKIYLSSISKGVPKTEITKQKMRKPKSVEHSENIRKANLGKKLSEETKRKISESRKRKKSV
jgi:hypothetical protein